MLFVATHSSRLELFVPHVSDVYHSGTNVRNTVDIVILQLSHSVGICYNYTITLRHLGYCMFVLSSDLVQLCTYYSRAANFQRWCPSNSVQVFEWYTSGLNVASQIYQLLLN